mmetsp:Transcript_18153/g.50145  ORF Transcript_18153/g.50145 Transcript_18153/m.50145 type:complete len:241 (+) Transcript_18153:302-1024(+)
MVHHCGREYYLQHQPQWEVHPPAGHSLGLPIRGTWAATGATATQGAHLPPFRHWLCLRVVLPRPALGQDLRDMPQYGPKPLQSRICLCDFQHRFHYLHHGLDLRALADAGIPAAQGSPAERYAAPGPGRAGGHAGVAGDRAVRSRGPARLAPVPHVPGGFRKGASDQAHGLRSLFPRGLPRPLAPCEQDLPPMPHRPCWRPGGAHSRGHWCRDDRASRGGGRGARRGGRGRLYHTGAANT